MKKLNEAVERFCALHPRLGIPGLMRYIVGANAVIYLLSLFARGGSLNFLCMDPASVLRGELWRIVTYVLLPTNGGIFLVISLFFYYWLGESLERLWGSTKFTVYYVSGTLLTALASLLAYLIDGISVPIYGAVYVNTALFLAFALNYPDAMVNIYFIIPVKMKWLAALEGILYALSVVTADRVKAHTRPQAVQFRRAVKEQQRQKGYHHKCSVCGRTDTDYPDLQFRYCSKCAGYHCFCEDHIFNHTHFTE